MKQILAMESQCDTKGNVNLKNVHQQSKAGWEFWELKCTHLKETGVEKH